MEAKLTSKSTKNEILEAYNTLLKKEQQMKTEDPKKVQEQQTKEELVKKSKSLSNEGIIKNIADLKVSFSSTLDKMGDQFVAEFKQFEDLQQAINIEKKNLEDLYQLSANTDSLSVMLLTEKEMKQQFEQDATTRKQELEDQINDEKQKHEEEMKEKRALWEKEQEERLLNINEENTKTKKEREREEEEYNYNLKLTRKKESDLYEGKKQIIEKEILESQAKMNEAETELLELRKESAAFPQKLDEEIKEAIKNTTDKLEQKYKFEKELNAKEIEGETKLKDQIIASLNAKIKEMEATLKELSQKTVTAEAGVKDIALKAIEGASTKQYSLEQQSRKLSEETSNKG